LVLIAAVACSGASSDSVLGSGDPALASSASPLAAPEYPIREGLFLAAAPEAIELDPCDPEAPTDPDSGKLLGKAALVAILRDANLEPIVGAEVSFSASAGLLDSMGQPVLTDENGLARDTLAVDEDDAGDVVVTAVSGDLTETITVPVTLKPKPPLTLEMEPAYLWPPNHQLRDVTAVFGGADCEPAPTIELVSVTSSEPDNGTGDGNTTDDIQSAEIGAADTEFRLRAERAGGGDGRVYTVTYRVTDAEGVAEMFVSTVTVPHDQGH